MFDPKQFDAIAKKIGDKLPEQLKTVKEDVELNVKHVLSQSLSKLDLITREEFDIQSKVLARTREKVTDLEQRIAELEKKLSIQ